MKDFLEIGGTEYRVEVNWNTIGDFLDIKGYEFSDMAKLGALKVGDVTTLLWCAIIEGERLEGRQCELKERDLGALIGPNDITAFLEVFRRHFSGNVAQNEGGSVKKKKNRWITKK